MARERAVDGCVFRRVCCWCRACEEGEMRRVEKAKPGDAQRFAAICQREEKLRLILATPSIDLHRAQPGTMDQTADWHHHSHCHQIASSPHRMISYVSNVSRWTGRFRHCALLTIPSSLSGVFPCISLSRICPHRQRPSAQPRLGTGLNSDRRLASR